MSILIRSMFFLRKSLPALKPTWPKTLQVVHEGRNFIVALKASPRSTRLSLRLRAGEQSVLLTAPPRAKLSDIESFALRHAGWIAERVRKTPPVMKIEPDGEIPYKGDMIRLMTSQTRGVHLIGNELHVGGELSGFKRRVLQFLMSEARIEVTKASERYAQSLGVTITSITLRDTKSRWGSCSSIGGLNYSWRIIMAPPDILNYLCAHEVAHRREMNHSPRFWAIVKMLYPDFIVANKWLKKHGGGLLGVS